MRGTGGVDKSLEGRLIEDHWISRERCAIAREEAERTGHSLWFSLVKLRYLSEEEIIRFFACESGIPFVRIADYAVATEILEILDRDFCIQHVLFPLFTTNNTLFVASNNPFDAAVADAVARMSRMNVEFLFSDSGAIRAAQESYWHREEALFLAEDSILNSRKKLYGFSLYRKSERLPLMLPVIISIRSGSVMFSAISCLKAVTTDITRDGRAVGIDSAFYLPPQLPIYIEFVFNDGTMRAEAEVVYCRMRKEKRYVSGVELRGLTSADKAQLIQAL